MKRILAVVLAALTLFSLTECGQTPPKPVTPDQQVEPAPTVPQEPVLTPEEQAEQERLAAEQAREKRLQTLLDSIRWKKRWGSCFSSAARKPMP